MKKNILIAVLTLISALLLLLILSDKRIVIRTDHTENTEQQVSAVTSSPSAATEKMPEATTEQPTVKPTEQATSTPTKNPMAKKTGRLVVIDPGHQSKGNFEKEPIAPGASEKKAKVASGTSGTATGVPEYKVTLQISQKLANELEKRGYSVLMTRTQNDVNISNSQRAQMANDANADVFVRIHCNGVNASSTKGALTMCQTAENKYCGKLYKQSRRLSECVLDGLCAASGAKKIGVQQTDTMSGINWCNIPVTIVETGFMTNPEEDRLLNDSDYQSKLANGIANGIDEYFGA